MTNPYAGEQAQRMQQAQWVHVERLQQAEPAAAVGEPKVKMNPWIPMRNPVDLKVAGKLLEELGELTAILSRCVIQGVHEREPVTGKLNKLALEEEIADVMTGLELLARRFDLDRHAMNQRIAVKLPQLEEWHKMTPGPAEPPPEPTPPVRKSWWAR
jgi:NTP pyrophosphatase (non-canonical NTP hydrolase)